MENPYSGEPLQVTLCDVSAGKPVRSYMFLGGAPKGVLAAAARGVPRSAAAPPSKEGVWPETRWGPADAAALQRHYGPRWQRLLTPCVRDAFPPVKAPPPAQGGAAEPDFGNLDDFDDSDLIFGEEGAEDSSPAALAPHPSPGIPAGPAWARVSAPTQARPPWDPATVYSEVAAYPEDTFADLKLKIYVASGVPPYRQHLFYGWGDAEEREEEPAPPGGAVPPPPRGRPVRTTYVLSVEGVPLPTDVRLLAQGLEGGGAGAVAGVPVDPRLEERKEDVRVDALDGFRTLREGPGLLIRRVFVADLATLLAPHQEALGRALADRYQADLLYYGLALKYWPQLSPDAFRLAVAAPNQIPGAFPLLEPSLARVEARFRLEQELLDRIYAQAAAQARREEGAEARGGVAVTEARVHIDPRGGAPLGLRNIFDWVATGRAVPAVVARIPPQSAWGSEEPGRRGRDLVVEKRHVSAAAPALAAPLERFLARPPRRPGIAFALLRGGGEGGAPPRFAYLTLYADGRYALQGGWREDDRVGFDGVVRQLSAAAGPLIKEVNAMGAAALPLGGGLLTPEEETRGRQGREALGALAAETLTVSTFWAHPLTSAGFQAMKDRWRDYERAGIAGIRGLQQGGAYAFYFRKGVTAYNRRAAERALFPPAARGEPAGGAGTNLYAHLTDPALAIRWDQAFPGRLVRIVHRTSDLRVEVVGATLPEFERIRRYVYVFLDGLLHGPRPLAHPRAPPAAPRHEGRLRSLRERDPDLFDLKKYDEGATVYSVLCQGDRQPLALSAEEARGLGEKEKEGLVGFWNFSEGRPAFYRCPTKRFPFLSFRAGEHPLGYCLPCCKKTLALPGSRALAVNRLCLAKHRVSAEEAAAAGDHPIQARHVLAYGKSVPPGRISWPPPLLSEALFYDALPAPYVFTLQGVEQHLPALPDAGFFFALAAVIELEPSQLARELADAAEALEATYYALAEGRAAFFPSGSDLAAAVLSTFAPDSAGGAAFSPFGPGGGAAEAWRDLLADLFSIRFDVEVLTFADAAGNGDVIFHARPRAAARLRGGGGSGDVALVVVSPSGTYPFVAMDHREFLARPSGVSTARRFFSAALPGGELADGVVAVLRGMAAAGGEAPPPGGPTLASAFLLAQREGWGVLYKLVNLRDFCYGLLLAPDPRRPDDWAYLPVPNAAHFLGPRRPGGPPAVAAHYGPRPPGRYPPEALARVLLAIGEEAAPTARLVAPDGALVGFIGGGAPRLYYHHDPVPPSAPPPPWGVAALPAARVPYPMEEVDRAIYSLGGVAEEAPLPPATAALAEQGVFRDNLYPLFVAEFAAVLRGERDAAIREELQKLVRKTRFGAPGALAAFRAGLRAVLAGFPPDIAALGALAAGVFSREGPERTGKALAAALEATAFGFDRTTLARLRARGREDRRAAERELREVMTRRVEASAEAPGVALPNIYVACSLPTALVRPQCDGGRLRIPSAMFGSFTEILMSDILNPGKDATLAAMTTGIIEEHRFIIRPGEKILIRQAP